MKEYLKTWRRPTRQPYTDNCLIWNVGHASTITELWEPTGPNSYVLRGHWVISDRAGGSYVLWRETKPLVESLNEQQKARLTTWLIDQRNQGVDVPIITKEVVEYTSNKRNLQAHERAQRLLQYIASQAKTIVSAIDIRKDTLSAYAWSESVEWEEVVYLLNYLRDGGWLKHTGTNNVVFKETGLAQGVVTVQGFNQIATQSTNVDSTQAFVAIWFNKEMDSVYDHGILPAVEAAGFKPYRADREHYLGKIDDQIIAEIRRSRFLIADMTHGSEGARGSVYFEAGFAFGLNIPVIYTCRKDILDILHFDTRQYPHIDWTNEDIKTFCLNLENRIRATVV